MAKPTPIEDDMPKAYEPGKVEQKWFKFWLEKDYFRAEIDPQKKPFVCIMPLPNVTGGLHMGRVCFLTPEDILTRWHRMKGDSALWLPGIDHAGIGVWYWHRTGGRRGRRQADVGHRKGVAALGGGCWKYGRHWQSPQWVQIAPKCLDNNIGVNRDEFSRL